MVLNSKYKELIDTAVSIGINDLRVREENNVLYVDGTASNGAAKDQLWAVYNKIDPDFRSGDLILNLNVAAVTGSRAQVVTQSSNLNIRKGPGTDQEIVAKAAHNEVVTILSQPNDQWSLVRTDKGVEGYAYTQYLQIQ